MGVAYHTQNFSAQSNENNQLINTKDTQRKGCTIRKVPSGAGNVEQFVARTDGRFDLLLVTLMLFGHRGHRGGGGALDWERGRRGRRERERDRERE